MEEAEKGLILRTLEHTKNNKTRAAEILGISLKTLHNKLKEYGAVESEEVSVRLGDAELYGAWQLPICTAYAGSCGSRRAPVPGGRKRPACRRCCADGSSPSAR